MSCFDEEKFGCTMSLLDSEAHRWWNTINWGTIVDRLTWEYFLDVFKRKFMGEQYRLLNEFLDLVQCDLIVADYEKEFVWLSQYAPEMVLIENDQCKRFHFGLNHEIWVYLVAQNTKMFDELGSMVVS